MIILTNREGNDVPHVFPAGGLYVAAFLWKSDGTNHGMGAINEGWLCRSRAEAEELLGSSIEGAIEMCLPLWRRVWGLLGTGTLNIRVVR